MNINATIIAQMVSFIIFIAFSMKFVWPPIMQALEERKTKIANGLEAAKLASEELELTKMEAIRVLQEGKKQASEIINQANKRAIQIVEEAKEQVLVESKRLRAIALSEIGKDTVHAREMLRNQFSAVVLAGAEKILGAVIDEKEHEELIEQLAKEI